MTKPNDEPRAAEARSRNAETAERAVAGLFQIGRLWATHGLRAGRAALETSAETLRVTSGLLGELSERLAEEAEASTEEPPASEEPGAPTTA